MPDAVRKTRDISYLNRHLGPIQMFRKLLKKPLVVQIGERTLSFNSLADFEFCLSSRTELPSHKIALLFELSDDALKNEAKSIHRVEKRFVEVLSRSLGDPLSIGSLIRELGQKLFSQDHEWRSLVAALIEQGQEYNDFKKMALVKYMQYLGSRQDVLKAIYASRLRGRDSVSPQERELEPEAQHKETIIFDLPKMATPDSDAVPGPDPFERLPRGETVAVRLANGREIEVLLSKNRFRLVPGSEFHLTDERGADYPLRSGKNTIGRDAANEVVIDPAFRDVSRTHLIVEPVGLDAALLTDLSSHGTFVPTYCIE